MFNNFFRYAHTLVSHPPDGARLQRGDSALDHGAQGTEGQEGGQEVRQTRGTGRPDQQLGGRFDASYLCELMNINSTAL